MMKVAGRRKDGRTDADGGIIGRGRGRTHHLHREGRGTLLPPSVRVRPSGSGHGGERAKRRESGRGRTKEEATNAMTALSLFSPSRPHPCAGLCTSICIDPWYLASTTLFILRHSAKFTALSSLPGNRRHEFIFDLKSEITNAACSYARGRSFGRFPTISFFASFAAPEAGSETALAI